MNKTLLVKNSFGENLDCLIEGNEQSDRIIIFVHGKGTDKHEKGMFDDLANSLIDDFLLVRFDFSGCGKSEGREEDICYSKGESDLKDVVNYVRKNYSKKIYILAQSMGCLVTALLCPEGVEKIILTGIPNTDADFMVKRVTKRILDNGGSVDEQGMSIYHRSNGATQKIGPKYWKDLREIRPIEIVSRLATQTKLTIIHPAQDDVVGNEFIEEYKTTRGANFIEMNGNHNFSKTEDRQKLLELVKEIFNN